MSRRLVVYLAILILLPLAAVAWLGVSHLRNQERVFAQQYRDLLLGRLQLVAAELQTEIDRVAESCAGMLPCDMTGNRQAVLRRVPLAGQVFVLDPDSRLRVPDTSGVLSAQERDFVERTRDVMNHQSFTAAARDKRQSAFGEISSSFGTRRRTPEATEESGWLPWYWHEGLHVLYWRRCPDGSVVGMEVERVMLTAQLVGGLPEEASESGMYRLRDAAGQVVYQWGSDDSVSAAPTVLARVNLPDPFRAWSLSFESARSPLGRSVARSRTLFAVAALAAVFVVVMFVAVYFYRESSRDLREARMRVHFVNQVSHELKTPLTNIRLYAEMLKDSLGDDPAVAGQLDVVLSESGRLSRMITNILTFARKSRSKLQLHPADMCVDTVVAGVLEQCRLSLQKHGIDAVEVDAGASREIRADADAVGQIVANLISNVEKYAATGGYLGVRTRQDDTGVTIEVTDHGPGVPAASVEKVFEPYHRESDSLTEGVSGAGIGLSISRDLARMHGGDLTLQTSEEGCVFVCRLPDGQKT